MRKQLTKLLDCFFLLRIPLLAPVWTIVILGWVTGHAKAHVGGCLVDGMIGGVNDASLWLAVGGFSLVVAAIYVGNQIADIESDRINGKLFILPHGLVSVRTAWMLTFMCAVAGLAIAFLFDLNMFFLFGVGLFLGILYDLPPASLKNHAWGGTVACFLGHGVLTYVVGWYAAQYSHGVTAGVPLFQTFRPMLLADSLVPSLAAGFANAAVFVTTTIPDAPGDRAIGKRTFAVAYGAKKTAIAATLFCLGAVWASWYIPYNRMVMLVPSVLSLLGFGWLMFCPDRDTVFKAFKWPVFLLTALVAIYVPLYGLLIMITFVGSRMYYRSRFGFEYPTFKSQ